MFSADEAVLLHVPAFTESNVNYSATKNLSCVAAKFRYGHILN